MEYTLIQFKPKQKFHVIEQLNGKSMCIKTRNKSLESVYKTKQTSEIENDSTCQQCVAMVGDAEIKRELQMIYDREKGRLYKGLF